MKQNPPLARVLVIDDDPVSLALTTLLLEAEGLNVRQRTCGEDACGGQDFDGWAPDLVLADLRMPGLHGSELAEKLAQRWPQAHRIAMSAATPLPVAGYAAVLEKPLPMDGLRAMLEQACRADLEPTQIQNGAKKTAEMPALDGQVFAKLEKSMTAAALRQLLEVLLADTGQRIQTIERALDAGDTATVKREAHTLRGSAGMSGAMALNGVARNLETSVDSVEDQRRHFVRLVTEYERLSVILASKLL